MKNIKILVLIILLAGAGWFVWNSQVEKPIDSVVVSYVGVPDLDFLFTVMKDKGFAEKNRIDVVLVGSDPAEAERKLADRVDNVVVGVFNPISMVRANEAKDIELRAFSPLFYTYHTILVKKDSPINTLEDLKGKKIAMRPKESAAYNAVEIAMREAGLSLEKDFQLTFTDIAGSIGLVGSGGADATLVPLTATVSLLGSGKFKSIESLDEIWLKVTDDPMPFIDFAAHKDWLEANPKIAKRFRQMVLDTSNYIYDNPGVIDEYLELLRIEGNDEAIALMKERLPLLYPTVWDTTAHEFTLDRAAQIGLISEVPDDIFVK